ncbi:hypothetical protein IPM65_07620 [Candidatus Roizmanbacteria bacterium]|nr:MAG: hypothetical protein IPM65_07620 [Candidatus Roizmanbacteria bacterium]
MKFTSLTKAQDYLFSFRKSNSEQKSADFSFQRVVQLAKLMGDPQNKIRVIHVAGTSGKGSTVAIISRLLQGHGMKVGVSISPHLYDIRERASINQQLLPEKTFLQYINEMIPAIHQMADTEYGNPSFFEIMIVLAYYIFFKEGADYAVMETGAGGRVDATNVANSKNKIAVISKIGLDHIDILGKTLKAIAGQKADIIHKGNIAVSIKQRPTAQKVVEERVRNMDAQFSTVIPGETFRNIKTKNGQLMFDYHYKTVHWKNIVLSLNGLFQVENASLALSAVHETSVRDGFALDERIVREVLNSVRTPGRFDEVVIEGKRIIIDGAHNPQKMSAFIRSLKKKHPNTKFDFLIAFKHGKDYLSMLKYIIPIIDTVYVTRFDFSEQVLPMEGEPAENIELMLSRKYHVGNIQKIVPVIDAFHQARKKPNTMLVITGSLYLIAELYRQIHTLIEQNEENIQKTV